MAKTNAGGKVLSFFFSSFGTSLDMTGFIDICIHDHTDLT